MDDISKGQAECKEEELAVTALRKGKFGGN